MANDTGKLLKEISSLSSNMDILFQELKEQNKNNSETSKGLKDLASSIKDSSKGEGMEQTFKSFTDSFAKTFSEQNNKLISSLSEKITQSFTGSVSDFLSNVPNQVAQVKAGNSPDFKSLLGGNTIKSLVKTSSSKIPGLAQGGTVEKDGLAIVGEKGPELVQLSAKSSIMDNDAYEDAEDALLGVKREKSPLESALSKITTDATLVKEFLDYAQDRLDESDRKELVSDPDYLKDEFDYFVSERGRETFTMEDVKNLTKPIEKSEESVPVIKAKIEEQKNNASVENSMPALTEKTDVSTPPVAPATTTVTAEKTSPSLAEKASANLSTASSIEAMRQQILNKLPPEKRAQLESSLSSSKGALVKETTGLKEKAPEAKPAPTPAKTEEPAKKSTDELKSQLSSQMKELGNQVTTANQKKEQMQMMGQGSQQSSLNPKDVSEIKTLLASIYTALKSPLTISSDFPFRPNSNNF
jgi:ribosomal protein L29